MRLLAIGLPATLAVPLLVSAPVQRAAAAAVRTSPACGWTIVPSRSPGTLRNTLFGAAAAPGGQVWAVGDRVSQQSARFVAPVAERWDGAAWRAWVMPGDQSNLLGVYAPGRANVWAVGFYIIELEHTLPVIDHFNGTRWAAVPNPRIGYGVLSAIGGTSANDMWAVGRQLGRPTVTIAEHYDGHAWRRVASPSPLTDYIDFSAITVRSRDDVWVAGDYLNSHGVFKTLIEHYDGHAWTIVPSPSIGRGDNYLTGIARLGAHRLQAVGRAFDGVRFRPLGLRWNGHVWRARFLPAAGHGDNALNAVTAGPGHTLWAVGSAAGPAGTQRTLTERYRGGHWRIVASPNANTADNILYAAALTGGRDLWAAGNWTSPSVGKTLTMRRCAR
jgi:hypothetical protein